MIYNDRTADELALEEDAIIEKIQFLEALKDTWFQSFHAKGPSDIPYVAKLQEKIRNLRSQLAE